MDAIAMLQAAAALFLLAAGGGLAMAWIRIRRVHNPPAWLSMLHGLLAAAGLTLVAYAWWIVGAPPPAGWALALFAIAAAGGAALNLGWQWKRRPLPVSIVLVHATLAVAAFACLFVAAF